MLNKPHTSATNFLAIAPTGSGKTMFTASMENAWFGDRRCTSEMNELWVSPGLRDNADRVRIDHLPPERTPAGDVDPECITGTWDNRVHVLTAPAGEDLLVGGGIDRAHGLAMLRGSVPIVVIHPLVIPRVARHSTRALAFWCQEELGLAAEAALLQSLDIHYGVGLDELLAMNVGFKNIRDVLKQARWSFNPLKESHEDRYPLTGINARDAQRVNTVLKDIVNTLYRKTERVWNLLRQILPEMPHVILTFSHLDLLTYLPGVQIDLLGVAHDLVPPRTGVHIVSGRYVNIRLRRGEERVVLYDDFSTEAPARLWEAMKVISLARRGTVERAAPQMQRAAPFVALLTPLLLVLLAILSVLTPSLLGLGVAVLVGVWAVCAWVAIGQFQNWLASRPPARKKGRAAARVDADPTLPEVLQNRARPVEANHYHS